jgi:hypothetical protein
VDEATMATTTRAARRSSSSSGSLNGAGRSASRTAGRAKGRAAAAGAAVGGLAVGTALGAKLRLHRRPHLLGLPLPSSHEVRTGAQQVARTGRRLYELESDVRALRAQADTARRQSPIEVLLSALTSRRLPRKT